MITAGDAFDQLVEASPSYFATDDLDGFIAAFEDEGTPDLYVRAAALAHHVVALLAAGRDGEARAVFDVMEGLLTAPPEDGTGATGDDPSSAEGDARELVVIGVLEPLQNIVSHDDVLVGPDRVLALVGPETARVWMEHDALWRDAAEQLHDGPRMDDGDYRSIVDPNLRRYYQAHKRRLDDGTLIGASDIVNYHSRRTRGSPVAGGGFPWPALVVGLVLALAVAVALYR